MTVEIVEIFRKYFQKNQKNNENPPESSLILRQCLIIIGPLLLTTNLGMIFGYSAVLLPQLESNTTTLKITENQATWIASIVALPMAFGCLISMFLMETIGRKLTQLLITIPLVIGWLLIGLTNQNRIEFLLIGRFLHGICIGILGPITPVYISETTIPELRNYFLPLITLNLSLGILLIHVFGIFLHWQFLTLIPLILLILTIVCLLPIPKSPVWLLKLNRVKEAELNFYQCYNRADSLKFNEIVLNYQGNLQQSKFKKTDLLQRQFVKPLLILIVFFIVTQWSGINAITFYTITIIKRISNNSGNIDEYLVMIIIDLIRLIVALISCVLLKYYGRRTIVLISGIGTFLTLFLITVCLYYPIIIDNNLIIIIAILLFYIVLINLGYVPIPWIMVGELFPLKQRNYGTSLTSMVAFLTFFSVVQVTPLLLQFYNISGVFLIFCLFSLVGTIFLYFYLPETRNKQLIEIEQYFRK